jgi:signal transduction histidine kinase
MADAAAHELQKFARLVTGVLGHELRTPITWIRAYSEILLDLRSDMDQEELDAALEGIKSGSDRLARLVEDAVLLVSLDTGQAETDYRVSTDLESDLAGRLKSTVSDMRPAADAAGVRLKCEPSAPLPPVLLAPRQFAAIMRHLLENAIKFAQGRPDPWVHVGAVPHPDGAEIRIEDNGIGIPPGEMERIFEPLMQVDRLRQEQQGIGIGLAIARGLVALHGGETWAESEPGIGTTVHFTLPAAAGGNRPGEDPTPANRPAAETDSRRQALRERNGDGG